MLWESIPIRLLKSRLGRCLANSLFCHRARQRLQRLDAIGADRAQARLLRGLIHQAQQTQFGLDHDFQRIRNVEDFQRLVPLRAPSDLWREYGLPNLPTLENALWPGSISWLATFQGPSTGSQAPIPITPSLSDAYRETLLTALAFVTNARPQAELLLGSVLLVGGDMALTPVKGQAADLTLETWANQQAPWWIRPYTLIAPQSGSTPLEELAEQVAHKSITCLVGSEKRLLGLWEHLRGITGEDCFRDVWPNLAAVICTRSSTQTEESKLSSVIDREGHSPPVLMMDALVHPMGALAVEDPSRGQLRMLPEHGLYVELVPLDDLNSSHPTRLGIYEAQVGVPYSLVLTSAAGLWACQVGLTICFDSLEPPLIRSVELLQAQSEPAPILSLRADSSSTLPAPTAHRQNADTQAAHPKKLSRSPWSAHADLK